MKQNNYFKRMLSAVLLLLASTFTWAYDFSAQNADGVTIYYNNDGGTEVEVTSGDTKYSGVINIPETVVYNGKTYHVTRIGDAFDGCSLLTSINIPNSVIGIGWYAFQDCSALTSIDIPNSVIRIGASTFRNCSSLTSIVIPESLTEITWNAFQGCSSLESMTVSANNPVYDSREGCNAIIEKATNTLISGCKNTIIPNSVTSIGDNAFSGCSSLTSINIPNSVTSIGDGAFVGCSALTSINIPNSVTSIGDGAFQGSALTSINIPNSVTSIGGFTFFSCSSLTAVNIPGSVTSIEYNAFRDCSALASVVIGDGVTSIGESAFYGCSSLTAVNIPGSVTSIGDWAFGNCYALASVVIGDGVTSIGDRAFNGCSSLTAVNIPGSVTSIGDWAFFGCYALASVVIGDGVTSIGESAFYHCSSLTAINIPDSVTSIENYAFYGCDALASINIPDGVTSIGNYAFHACLALTSINIPASVTSIGGEAFAYCSSLTSVISEIEDPFIIDENVFASWDWEKNIYSSAILYCPNPELYKETDGWKNFVNIRPLEGKEEVTLAIGDAHYATFIAPFDVTIPTNVEAYTVSGIKEDGQTLQLDELMGTIPANTPVVLYSNDIVKQTITGTRTTQGLTYTYGLLTGVYTEIQAPLYSYVLQNQNDKVAFYYVNNSWNRPAVTANHAYLTVPEGANGVKALRFSKDDDETTGIQATMSDQESKAVIYDMTGRRVEKAVKGMYIIDGKKVMVK